MKIFHGGDIREGNCEIHLTSDDYAAITPLKTAIGSKEIVKLYWRIAPT